MQFVDKQCSAAQHIVMQCSAVQHIVMQCSAAQHIVMHCSAVQNIVENTEQYIAVERNFRAPTIAQQMKTNGPKCGFYVVCQII